MSREPREIAEEWAKIICNRSGGSSEQEIAEDIESLILAERERLKGLPSVYANVEELQRAWEELDDERKARIKALEAEVKLWIDAVEQRDSHAQNAPLGNEEKACVCRTCEAHREVKKLREEVEKLNRQEVGGFIVTLDELLDEPLRKELAIDEKSNVQTSFMRLVEKIDSLGAENERLCYQILDICKLELYAKVLKTENERFRKVYDAAIKWYHETDGFDSQGLSDAIGKALSTPPASGNGEDKAALNDVEGGG